jgi:CheY-like chemotaxis protein
LLASDGHEVATADGVSSAREAAQHRRFDLLLCDIGLRDGDGCELLRELQKLHGLQGIAISGYGMPEDMRRFQEAGFACHLLKPVTMEQLRLAIQRTITASTPPAGDN